MRNTWYQKAVVYSLDVETFYDGNDDGVGDFQGLIDKLGYLAGLGITCLWLLPFYPSPNHDNGYDVMDYYNVDPKFGTLGDFSEFIARAGEWGIRVIIDLVVNHTSNRHPWFLEARKSPGSPYRDYYVWSDEPKAFDKSELMFQGEERSVWTYDQKAGQYYLHRFYKEQPDLNISNPNVREEIIRVMGFWLQLGVSGFRIDAAEILIEPYAMDKGERGEAERILDEMRDYIEARGSDAILLAEANIRPDKIATYLDGSERMHLLFNFYINQQLFLALADGRAATLADALERLPPVAANHWLQFLRHHDELSLRLLTDAQRERVFQRFAPEEPMRIYGQGIRRRLAPMLGGDGPLLRMVMSLMFCLPGIPLLRYGDEIGMGDDLSLEGRESVRTAMQWADLPNGGFSRAPAGRLRHPVMDGPFGYEQVNVLKAVVTPDSLLCWVRRLIAVRKLCQEIIEEPIRMIRTDHKSLLVHTYRNTRHQVLLLHNLSDRTIVLDKASLGFGGQDLHPIFGDLPATPDTAQLLINPFGYRWYKIYLT